MGIHGKFFYSYLNVTRNDRPAGQLIQEIGADAVLTAKGGSIDEVLKESPEWKPAYRDSAAVVYEKIQ